MKWSGYGWVAIAIRWMTVCTFGAISFLIVPMTEGRSETVFKADQAWPEASGWAIYWNASLALCVAEQLQSDGNLVGLGAATKSLAFGLGFRNSKLESLRKDETYKTRWQFDGRSELSIDMTLLHGYGNGPMLVSLFEDPTEIRAILAESNELTIQLGERVLVKLSLKGSAAAINAMDECYRTQRNESGGSSVASKPAQDLVTEADKLEKEAWQHHNAGDFAQAEMLFRRAQALWEKAGGPDHPAVAANLNNQALLLRDKGDFEESEALFRRAIAIFETALGADHPDKVQAILSLANMLRNQGKLDAAEPLFRRAVEIRERALGQDHIDLVENLDELASLLRDNGRFEAAETTYRRVLAILERTLGPEHADVATTLHNLANVLRRRANDSDAESLHRRALAIREKVRGQNHPDVALSLNGLGNLYRDNGDIALAERLYRRALAILEATQDANHADLANVLNNLAALIFDNGDIAGAEPLYRRALVIQERTLGPEHADVGRSLNHLAILHEGNGELDEAEQLYRRALAILEKSAGPEHPDVAESMINLANMLADKKKDLAGSEELHRRVVALLEKSLGTRHPRVAESLNDLAFVLAMKDDFAGSLELARRAANSGYPSRGILIPALAVNRTERLSNVSESFAAVQQTASSEAGAAIRSSALRTFAGSEEQAALVRTEQDLAKKLAALESDILVEIAQTSEGRRKSVEDRIRAEIAQAATRLADVREELKDRYPEYIELSRPLPVDLDDMKRLLADDEALIVVDIAGEGQGADYVWVVTSDIATWERIDSRNGETADGIARLRAGLDLNRQNRSPINPTLAHDLYKRILGPVENVISCDSGQGEPVTKSEFGVVEPKHAGKCRHLIFVLNGAASSLPPQVLVTKPPLEMNLRDIAWLARDYSITVLPTVSSLKLLRGQTKLGKAPKPFRGYGDPVFDPAREGSVRTVARGYSAFFRGGLADIEALKASAPRLPGTARELRAVAARFGVPESEIILREGASEAAVKQAPLADYNILYFATHGLVAGEVEKFNKDAAEPALLLTIPEKATELDDGLLTASEIAQLKLNADWVVLSACNTAAEGKPGAGALSGLARAFFYAGARSLLVSHWYVDDEATAALMSRTFASAAANPGRRQAEALREAMLSVMNDPDHPEWADPGYWAPFILVGEAR